MFHEPVCVHLSRAPLNPVLTEASKSHAWITHSLANNLSLRCPSCQSVPQHTKTYPTRAKESKVSSPVLAIWTEIKTVFHSLYRSILCGCGVARCLEESLSCEGILLASFSQKHLHPFITTTSFNYANKSGLLFIPVVAYAVC